MPNNVEYLNVMQAQLDKWDTDVDALRVRGRSIATEARAAYFGHISQLRASRDAGRRAFVAVRSAGEAEAGVMQVGMNTAWRRMSLALEKFVRDHQ